MLCEFKLSNNNKKNSLKFIPKKRLEITKNKKHKCNKQAQLFPLPFLMWMLLCHQYSNFNTDIVTGGRGTAVAASWSSQDTNILGPVQQAWKTTRRREYSNTNPYSNFKLSHPAKLKNPGGAVLKAVVTRYFRSKKVGNLSKNLTAKWKLCITKTQTF